MSWKKQKCTCGEYATLRHSYVGYDGAVKYYIKCKCGRLTGLHSTPQGAIKEWNKCKKPR